MKYQRQYVHHRETGTNLTPEYRTFGSMKTRCYNHHFYDYKNYGGKGITICSRWKNNYLEFLKDMGRRPGKNYTIERINNKKGYSKENCKWATIKEQNGNRGCCIIFCGELAINASKRLGGCRYLVGSRIKRGWSLQKAFTIPLF